ncbi:uncharacterized protein LOC126832834 [Adelges cooleyi]|uniref:uncharacterized protein LOC126832834 n=1 Tax=Adelges cooleyi TaxID=133065 RepID=UPI0021801356|nr:uncharacterized protein LOC126832834 [Adelges cooleyi]
MSEMSDIKDFVKSLNGCKSFKHRQQFLNRVIDYMAAENADAFMQTYREFKKRELEANDPNKIAKWLTTSNVKSSSSKMHEALMLVKGSNILAQEQYLDNLKRIFSHTLSSGENVQESVKLCALVEKLTSLANIHHPLKHLIREVKQMNERRLCTQLPPPPPPNAWPQYGRREVRELGQMINGWTPFGEHSTPTWPTVLQPESLTLPYPVSGNPSFFSLDCLGVDTSKMAANPEPLFNPNGGALPNLTIVEQDMDEAVYKWLHYLKLHKYQWFFNGLSYLEIECINEDTIESFIAKVNENSITKGAQKKICISTKALRDRPKKLKDLILAFDLEVTSTELCEHLSYMRDILHYPVPNKNCVVGDELQRDIVHVMEKILHLLVVTLRAMKTLNGHSLAGTSINKYLECCMLISGNSTFMADQVEKITVFSKLLKNKVVNSRRDFYV